MALIQLRDLTFTYPGGTAPALDHVTLDVHEGEFLTLCGPSGCGKTTLLRQLKPALAPHGARTGDILFRGRPLEGLSPGSRLPASALSSSPPRSRLSPTRCGTSWPSVWRAWA